MGKIILAGGSGFLGRVLSVHLSGRGHQLVVLTRTPSDAKGRFREVQWDGRRLGNWTREIDGADAVINLAGKSVDCRYCARNKRMIMDSRVDSTRVLGEAIGRSANPPPVWLNSSTATIYKHSLDRPMDEITGEIGATPAVNDTFSVEVARAWEKALGDARTPATRKVALRTSMVFGTTEGGVFQVLRRLVRFGLGGSMAGGHQFVSWIHEEDFCRAVDWLLTRPDLSGPVNVAAPNPVPNRDMMQSFRQIAGVSMGLLATRWMLEMGAFFLRTETELILKSRRVVPSRLTASGFQFLHPQLREAIADLHTSLDSSPKEIRS